MVEKIGEYKGYKYCILFMETRGYRNGYVSIENSPYYNRSYQNLPIYCVNLTFGEYFKPLDSKCIGWDHMDDPEYDLDSIKKYTTNEEVANMYISMLTLTKPYIKGNYTTLEDVEKECHAVIDELIKYSK